MLCFARLITPSITELQHYLTAQNKITISYFIVQLQTNTIRLLKNASELSIIMIYSGIKGKRNCWKYKQQQRKKRFWHACLSHTEEDLKYIKKEKLIRALKNNPPALGGGLENAVKHHARLEHKLWRKSNSAIQFPHSFLSVGLC